MSEFPPGFAVLYDGQRYTPQGVFDHTRQDGLPSRLIRWTTFCPACDAPFSCQTGIEVGRFPRRCRPCRQPLRPLTVEERARIAVRTERRS